MEKSVNAIRNLPSVYIKYKAEAMAGNSMVISGAILDETHFIIGPESNINKKIVFPI